MGSFHESRVLQSASEFDDNMEKKQQRLVFLLSVSLHRLCLRVGSTVLRRLLSFSF